MKRQLGNKYPTLQVLQDGSLVVLFCDDELCLKIGHFLAQ